ncbi:MAG: 4-hydroxy-3-methylbut-2-enyl diphosphate reductase, partial [Candidatus Puniceispirillum sp.]
SNSKRLVEVALAAGAGASMLIADKEAIDWRQLAQAKHIGLSAGASAPESLVEEVVEAICQRYDIDVSEVGSIKESMNFKLPTVLTS